MDAADTRDRGGPNADTSPKSGAAQRVAGTSTEAVQKLEAELRKQGVRRWLRRLIWIGVVVGGGAAWLAWRGSNEPPPEPRFRTAVLEVRDIVEKVESTGKLKPRTEVQVGAQVSGRVVAVHVDFNSQVKRGDLLAEIDPQLFGAQVGQVSGQLGASEANLERAKSRVKVTETELARMQQLTREGIATEVELDQAQSAADVAVAEVAAARATIAGLKSQLHSARTTLTYTKIHSPIDGVVILRAVESGQTVAASFSSPVLFVIAEDLSQMQVLADVDEADVGKLSEGMSARVTVDAFPGESFDGQVTQIRYSPNEVQGVVTYSAVIDVANAELKLRPGMTATVAVTTRHAKGELAAPNAALRFKPEERIGDLVELQHGEVRVYQISGGAVGEEQLSMSVAKTGITDGIWTQVSGEGLSAGTPLVTEQTDKKDTKRRFMGLF
jgi:HlyD family secretion protein